MPGRLQRVRQGHGANSGQAGRHDGPLRAAPAVRVGSASAASGAHRRSRPERAEHDGNGDDRQPQAEQRPGVDHAVDADSGQEETRPPVRSDGQHACALRPFAFRRP